MDCIEGCDHDTQTPYECTYCGERHCVYHRLPEKHDCVALAHAKTLGPELRRYTEATQRRQSGLADDQPGAKAVGVCIVCGNETEGDRELCRTCDEAEDQEVTERAKQQEEISELVSTKARYDTGTCSNCGSDTSQDRDLCPACERVKKERGNETTCAKCSDRTPPDKDLCLRCRRKAQTIDSSSPDITPTGKLEQTTSTITDDTETASEGRGYFLRRSAVAKATVLLAFVVVGLWGTGYLTVP